MESISNALQTALGWLEIIPLELYSIALGLILSLLLTQFVKRILPINVWLDARKSEAKYRAALRLISFAIAFLATFRTWPDDGPFRIYVALGVGLATPVFYQVATRIAYRYWTDLEAKLSGHRGADP